MRRLSTLIATAALSAGLTGATILERLTLEEMATRSTTVVRARVLASHAVLRGADVYTIYSLEILDQFLPGRASAELAIPGGIAGGLRQPVAGAPALRIGAEYVIFEWTGRSGLTQPVGLSQGVLNIERAASGDEIITRAPASEQMVDSQGRAVRDEPVSLKMTELRRILSGVRAKAETGARTGARVR
jgi:hypothetical protein